MIMDKLLIMSNEQAVTSTAVSTDVIDLGAAMDYGIGDNPSLKLMVQVGTLFVTGDAAVLTVILQGSDDDSNFYDMAESMGYAVADLTVGARLLDISIPRPPAGEPMPRYLRMNYVVTVGSFSAGKVTSAILVDRQDNFPPVYPAGLTVSN